MLFNTIKRLSAGLLLLALGSCDIIDMSEELHRLSNESVIGGQLRLDSERSASDIYLLVYKDKDPDTPHSYTRFKTGNYQRQFFFLLPAAQYSLLAFEDANLNKRYDPGEAVGKLSLSITQGMQENYEFELQLSTSNVTNTHIDIQRIALNAFRPGASIMAGQPVSLSDARFTRENARMGLWQPQQFLSEIGGGFFPLSAFDPTKKLVVLVHGALGHPGEWRTLYEGLDHQRYQFYVFFYPTAIGLERSSEDLAWQIYQLQHQLGIEQLAIVAHSMGGLVALRSVQLLNFHLPARNPVSLLISLSTPWSGHKGAAYGADYAPIPAPSWVDMAPGSRFLDKLQQNGIPAHFKHALLFSYKGRNSLGEKADGAVSLSSQLTSSYQDQAALVYGLNENHRSILKAASTQRKVAEALHRFLIND